MQWRKAATAVCAILSTAVVACGAFATRSASVSDVRSAFSHHGLPLAAPRRARIVGLRVFELLYDPAKLVTTTASGDTILHGQFLVVLVFDDARAAGRALQDARERRAMRAYGLTVIHAGNVVATILRGDATRDRIARVRAAVTEATRSGG